MFLLLTEAIALNGKDSENFEDEIAHFIQFDAKLLRKRGEQEEAHSPRSLRLVQPQKSFVCRWHVAA